MFRNKETYEGITVERDVTVEARDDTELAVDVFRPDTDDPVPALMAMSPYGKNIQRDMSPQPMPSPLGDACIEAGDTKTITDRGYAHVIADCRGTGSSGGEYTGMYDKQDGEDGYDIIEWIAAQPWCDGNVGMIGISYFGTIQLVIAAEQPPHLKAIAPTEATTNQYLACYHGGTLDGFYSELFTGRHSRVSWSGFQDTNVKSWSRKNLSQEELERRTERKKSDPDLNQYNLLYSILDCPEKNPIFFDIMLNEYSDSDYWHYPPLEDIEIPVLAGCNWFPDDGPKFVRGPFRIWDRVEGPVKLTMWPPGWMERPFHQYHDLVLDWHDRWMKGEDNEVMEGPPINLYVQSAGEYRSAEDWPLSETEWTEFYLRTHGRLSENPEPHDSLEPDAYVQSPLSVTSEMRTVSYETGPLEQSLEVTGPITLSLHASIDSHDSLFRVKLFDVNPANEAREVTHGHLKLSHRKLDHEQTKPWQPFHLHTEDAVEPVEPGEVNEYRIEFYPLSRVFRPGHKLRLEVASIDIPGEQFSYHIGRSETVTHRIYRDSGRPSHLYLPVIPR